MTTLRYYRPGQLRRISPCLPQRPAWLLLGGPADGNEAQTAVQQWPGVRVVGVDPNPAVVAFQRLSGWPEGAVLVEAALWKEVGRVPVAGLGGTDLRHASVNRQDGQAVTATTWAALDRQHGPFHDALLWMDIEGAELEALRGAVPLLARGAILAVNVEMEARRSHKNKQIGPLLGRHGLVPVKDWNHHASGHDRLFVRVRHD